MFEALMFIVDTCAHNECRFATRGEQAVVVVCVEQKVTEEIINETRVRVTDPNNSGRYVVIVPANCSN